MTVARFFEQVGNGGGILENDFDPSHHQRGQGEGVLR
jgi:hypothetical protein